MLMSTPRLPTKRKVVLNFVLSLTRQDNLLKILGHFLIHLPITNNFYWDYNQAMVQGITIFSHFQGGV